MKKLFKLCIIVIMVIVSLLSINVTALASDLDNENKLETFPAADGIDVGSGFEFKENSESVKAFWYSKYNYNSTSFSTGVYLNNGNPFSIKKSRSPYIENATHNKTKNSNPAYYRVSYQMINSSTGKVRKGIFFGGPIDNLKIKFDVKETGSFKFYIAGESRNVYSAHGTLRY